MVVVAPLHGSRHPQRVSLNGCNRLCANVLASHGVTRREFSEFMYERFKLGNGAMLFGPRRLSLSSSTCWRTSSPHLLSDMHASWKSTSIRHLSPRDLSAEVAIQWMLSTPVCPQLLRGVFMDEVLHRYPPAHGSHTSWVGPLPAKCMDGWSTMIHGATAIGDLHVKADAVWTANYPSGSMGRGV